MSILGFFKNDSGSHKPDVRDDMYLQTKDSAGMIHYELSSYGSKYVEWVSRETDENGEPVSVRIPEEKTTEIEGMKPFTLGGGNLSGYQSLHPF